MALILNVFWNSTLHLMMPLIPLMPVLLALMALSGCATAPTSGGKAAPDPIVNALRNGDCRGAAEQLSAIEAPEPEWVLQGAQVCLQVGDFSRSRELAYRFLTQAEPWQDTDYAAYLHALAGFGNWSRGLGRDPQRQVADGRALFQEITLYLDERPLSEYVDNLAPRLVRLREGVAAGELALAEQHYRLGDAATGVARARYVVEYFSRTQAAADAALWLLQVDAQGSRGALRMEIVR